MNKLHFIKNDADFKQFRSSKSYSSSLLKIRVVRARNQNHPRFGFIVPKKLVPKVVKRNLIKRRLKAILQKHVSEYKPCDVLIFPQARLAEAQFTKIEEEIIKLLKKSGCL